MSKMLEHALYELKLAGYDIFNIGEDINSDSDYINHCAKCAFDMLMVFSESGHSGMSAGITLNLFNKLVKWENLTKLTNNPDEWEDQHGFYGCEKGIKFQSKRKSTCFSDDGLKTYYDLDDMEVSGIDENGISYTKIDKDKQINYTLES